MGVFMPRENIYPKDRKAGIPFTHPSNTRSKDRTSTNGERYITHEESGNRKLSKKRKSNKPNQSDESEQRNIGNKEVANSQKSDLWGNKQQEKISYETNYFSRATTSVEQSSSPLKGVLNSPTRERNFTTPKSPGKENSPKKQEFSTISTSPNLSKSVIPSDEHSYSRQTSIPYEKNSGRLDFGNISPIKPQYPVEEKNYTQSRKESDHFQPSYTDSGVEFTGENSTLPGEPSELNLSKKNSGISGRSREWEHYSTGENDRLPGSREKRKLDSTIDEANQQSNSSNKKVRKITHDPYSVQTSTPLKNDWSFEDNKVNTTLIEPDEPSKKRRKLEDDSEFCSLLLKNDEELKKFLKKCKSVGKIAIHCDYEDKELSKVSLSCNEDEVYYIDEKFKQNALKKINELLYSGKVKKVIVYDIKEVKKTLPGIEKILDSVDDLKVMSYSLDTKKHVKDKTWPDRQDLTDRIIEN